MKPSERKKVLTIVKEALARVSKDRDWIRDQIDELESLRDSCDRAHDSLQDAVDALSELT